MPGYLKELQRRNVFRAVAAYVVLGWILLQVSTNLEDALNLPDWFDAVVTALLAIGFPIVVIFSWVYELTPEGLQKTSDVPEHSSVTPNTGRRLDYITAAGVVVIIGLLLANRFAPNEVDLGVEKASSEITISPAAENDKSIAVLPFVAMTDSREDEFFADGLSEELLNVLAKIDGLKVAGRTSAFYYKGKNEDLRVIAEALGVAHVLEGSVRRSGNKIRVTAQLIKADDGFHLWSETYDRDDGDIFLIQDEISSSVSQALQARILGATPPEEKRDENQVKAQNLFLVAQAALAVRELNDVRRARDLYAQAAILDPNNPKYLVGYAQAVALQYWNFRDITDKEAISEADQAIRKALSIEEPSADTLAVAGLVEELRALTGDVAAKEQALRYYQRAVALEPNNILALQWLASIYLDVNRPEESRLAFEKVVALDPINRLALTGLANSLAALGRHDEAKLHLYRMQSLFPDESMLYRYLSSLEWETGRLDQSLYWKIRAADADPNPIEIYSLLSHYIAFGWADKAMESAERYNKIRDRFDISGLVQAQLDKDYDAIAFEARQIYEKDGAAFLAMIAAWADAMAHRCPASIVTLEENYPSLKGEVIEYLASNDLMDAVLLAHCQAAVGNHAESKRLLNLLKASSLLSDKALRSDRSLIMVLIAMDAIAGDIAAAVEKLGNFNTEAIPVYSAKANVPIDELPVFENLYGEAAFKQYATREKYMIAKNARMFSAGETATHIAEQFAQAGLMLRD